MKIDLPVVFKAALIGFVVVFIVQVVSSVLARALEPMDVESLCCVGGLILVAVPGALYSALADHDVGFVEGAMGGALTGAVSYGVVGLLMLVVSVLVDVFAKTGGVVTLAVVGNTITMMGLGAVSGAIGGVALGIFKGRNE